MPTYTKFPGGAALAEHLFFYERLYNHILEEIRSGRLRSGDRVPSEKELAEQFGVSRITSKRALQMLEQAGLIERIRGKGSFVAGELPELDKLASLNGERPSRRLERAASCIAFVLPDASQSYGLELLCAIEERCAEHGLSLIVKRTRGRQDEEERAIDGLVASGLVKGLIVFPVHGEYYNASLLRLVLEGYPLVLVDRYLKGIPACAVYTDNVAASRALTGHLIDLGHEHIGFLSPPAKNTSSIEERLQGFRAAFVERGLGPGGQHHLTDLKSTLPNPSSAGEIAADRGAIRAFVEREPRLSAFVACEYNVALILRDVLDHLDRREGATIACFDSPHDPFAAPSFVHIKQAEGEMGRRAVDLLLGQLRREQTPPNSIVPFTLVTAAPTG